MTNSLDISDSKGGKRRGQKRASCLLFKDPRLRVPSLKLDGVFFVKKDTWNKVTAL